MVDSLDIYWHWLRQGWIYRVKTNKNLVKNKVEYTNRLQYESKIIIDKGFHDYMLIVSDCIRWAKDNGIAVGPGRGSSAASLVCYLLRITEVDPLQFPTMLFERFIDITRSDEPDCDTDIADDRRDEIRQYLISRYGYECVGNIGNFIRYKGKNSINDVARVYQIPHWASVKLNSLILERPDGDPRVSNTVEDTFNTFDQAANILDKFPALQFACALEGNYRGMSTHAAGIVVSNNPITDTCATYTRNNKSIVAYDKKDAVYLNMLKIDLLGLSTMTMIGLALEQVEISLDELYAIPLDDPKTIAGFTNNNVLGIFQFEGGTSRGVCAEIRPDKFLQLADINALSRPGPLFSGMTQAYIDVKRGKRFKQSLHPIVDEVTDWTYGQIVYEEQVLRIIKELGGFSPERLGDIRRAIKLKLGQASMKELKQEYLEGALRLHGVKEEQGVKIWNYMVSCSLYLFNIAHAVSYAMISYWQMWIKIYHPLAFYTASLETMGDDKETRESKLPRLLQDARRNGIRILNVDPNLSDFSWRADKKNNTIRAGWTQIPGLGAATAAALGAIRRARAGAQWGAWSDLTETPGVGPATVGKIVDFVKNEDPFGIDYASKVLKAVRKKLKSLGLPAPTHKSNDLPESGHVIWMGIVQQIRYKNLAEEKRSKGEELGDIKDPHLMESCVLKCYDDGDEDVYVRFSRWRYPRWAEVIKEISVGQDVVLIVGKKLEGFGASIYANSLVVLEV